jgi:ABC-type nitrate/sulfonate/bicarbonate transport system substrate-binding protein
MSGPLMVTAANLKANRAKWTRFVKAYIEATHYITVNKPGSIDVLKKFILPGEDNETQEHVYEQMRDRATIDLIAPEPAVENLIKMMTYVDKRPATIDRSKLSDYSIVRELIQNNAVPVKK